jgi:hypothetical protein
MQITIPVYKEVAQAKELSPAQKAYREFFLDRLEMFDVSSPAQLTEEVKSKFFSGITEAWEAYKEQHGIETKESATAASAGDLADSLEDGRHNLITSGQGRKLLL